MARRLDLEEIADALRSVQDMAQEIIDKCEETLLDNDLGDEE